MSSGYPDLLDQDLLDQDLLDQDLDLGLGLDQDPEKDQEKDPDQLPDAGIDLDLGIDTSVLGIDTSSLSDPISFQVNTDQAFFSTPDYTTSFCRPRQSEPTTGSTIKSYILTVAKYLDIGATSWYPYVLSFFCVTGFMILLFLWYLIRYPELAQPFVSGGIQLGWSLFIVFVMVSVLVLFTHYLYYIAYFTEVTIHYMNMTLNPLLNATVSSYCCFFSDYVNWLIFYPAMLYYLIIFILLILFDVLILMPILTLFGFSIGILFSLLGESNETSSKVIHQIPSIAKENKLIPSMPSFIQKGLEKVGLRSGAGSDAGAKLGSVADSVLGSGSGAKLGSVASSVASSVLGSGVGAKLGSVLAGVQASAVK